MKTRDDYLQNKPLIIAGPCSISSREQITKIAEEVSRLGATVLRAQLWKPRTNPDSFQGVGEEGLVWVKDIKEAVDIDIAMEVTSPSQVDLVHETADILWVGARNMQNFELLKSISDKRHPVILKNGLVANIKEWVGAAKYIGIDRVLFCERGIRTAVNSMRFTLDLNSMIAIQKDYNLPVLVDPSHTAGRRDAVSELALAGVAAGADGLVIETHYNPDEEKVDKDQTIDLDEFKRIVDKARVVYREIYKD